MQRNSKILQHPNISDKNIINKQLQFRKSVIRISLLKIKYEKVGGSGSEFMKQCFSQHQY